MSDQPEVLVPAAPLAQHGNPLHGARQLAYAWVGLWSVAAEDFGKLCQRCVARGEQLLNAQPPAAQPAVKPPAPDAAVTSPNPAASRAVRPMSIFNAFGAVESCHFDLNADQLLPTKAEFDALLERVEALSREVDALAERRER